MPTLKSGKIEIEIHFHKHLNGLWVEYSLQPRFGSVPMFHPLGNQDDFKDGKYIYCDFIGDSLIPFFEKLLTKKLDAEWNLGFDENSIKISAEHLLSENAEPLLSENIFQLHIAFYSDFFGDGDYILSSLISVTIPLSFNALEIFLQELKAEYEIFKVTEFNY